MTVMKEYKKGQPIFFAGDSSEAIYLLKSGMVKIYWINVEGKELTLAFLKPGEIFGELALIDEPTRDTAAIAYEDSIICIMGKKAMLELMADMPDIILRVMKIIGFRRKVVENRLQDLLFKNAHCKLAELILNLGEEYGTRDLKGTLIGIKLTHRELANLVGTNRETVSFAIGDLKKEGLIEIEGKRIIIRNEEGLKRLTSFPA